MEDVSKQIIGGALSGAASLLGIPWQQHLQKDLLHENAAINLEQWQRENEYNSPKEQMKRLREAGLNPDLAIGGNVANTSGQAELTAGTPQAPGAASAVGHAVSNAMNAQLLDSQIAVNESVAAKNTAQTKETEVDTEFKVKSMDSKLRELFHHANLTSEQVKVAVATTGELEMRAYKMSKEVENFNELFKLYDTQRVLNRALTTKAEYDWKLLREDLSFRTKYLESYIGEMESKIGLNNAYASQLRTQTNFLLQTFGFRVKQEHDIAFFARPQDRLFEQQARYQQALIQYLPYQMADIMLNASKMYERDKDGNLVYGSNGLPKLKQGYVVFQTAKSYVDGVLGSLEIGARAFGEAAGGVGMMRFGFGKGKMPLSVEKASTEVYSQTRADQLYMDYVNATPNSLEQRIALERWREYRKLKK